MPRNQNQKRNQLWLARKRLGLGQKHVAYLINHKTTDQVSRYEKGWRIPGLKMLLQLEIIYGVPTRFLYQDWYEELRQEIEAKASTLKVFNPASANPNSTVSPFAEFCFYDELLRSTSVSKAETEKARKHVILLMNRVYELEAAGQTKTS